MSFSLGGIHETARFHHGTWYCGYVATRGPGAATGEDEADRLINSAGNVSRISVSGGPFYRTFFEELSRLGYVEGQNLGVERYSGERRTLCRIGPRCRQHASRLDFSGGRSSTRQITRLIENGARYTHNFPASNRRANMRALYPSGTVSLLPLQLAPSPMLFFRRIVLGDWHCAVQGQHHSNMSVHQRPAIFSGHASVAACHSGFAVSTWAAPRCTPQRLQELRVSYPSAVGWVHRCHGTRT